MSKWLIERSTALLDRGTTRRGFLTRSALVGTASGGRAGGLRTASPNCIRHHLFVQRIELQLHRSLLRWLYRVLLHPHRFQQLPPWNDRCRMVEGRQFGLLRCRRCVQTPVLHRLQRQL